MLLQWRISVSLSLSLSLSHTHSHMRGIDKCSSLFKISFLIFTCREMDNCSTLSHCDLLRSQKKHIRGWVRGEICKGRSTYIWTPWPNNNNKLTNYTHNYLCFFYPQKIKIEHLWLTEFQEFWFNKNNLNSTN